MPDHARRKNDIRIPPVLLLLFGALVLYLAREIFVPIALAVLVAFVLTPAVKRLEHWGVPRVVGVVSLLLIAIGGLGALGWVVEQQAYDLAEHLPEYKTNIQAKLSALRPSGNSVLSKAGTTIAELGQELDQPAAAQPPKSDVAPAQPVPVRVVEMPKPQLSYVRTLLGPAVGPLATIGVVVIFAIFMLNKREDLRDRLLRLIGQRTMHLTTAALDDATQRITRYLTIQLILNATVGTIIGVGLFLLGVPGAAVWGLATGLFRFIPYVGTWVAAVLPLTVSLAVSPGWTQPVSALALIATVELVSANIVEPLIFRSGTGLSSFAILVASVFWTWLWGPVGLLLATPMTVCLAVIGRHTPSLKFLDVVLRDKPGLTPDAQFYQRLLAGDQHEAGQIVETFAKDKTLLEVYDSLVLPAMHLAELDRHRGELSTETEKAIRDMLAAIVEDKGGQVVTAPGGVATAAGGVLLLPARDWADELAAGMLSQLLVADGIRAAVLSSESFSGEAISQVAAQSPAVVCISAVPPAATVHIRVLCKRLKARFANLPIVAGIWEGPSSADPTRRGLDEAGADSLATTLAQAMNLLRQLAPMEQGPSVLAKVSPPGLPSQAG